MKIYPYIGVDNLYLGFSTSEVENLIGKPDDIEDDDWPNKEKSITWIYKLLGLEFRFDSENQYKLCVITITSKLACLENTLPIGLTEVQLKALYPSVILDDDFEENGKDYVYPKKEISFWVSNGFVYNLSVFPEYDKTGEVPIWPTVRS